MNFFERQNNSLIFRENGETVMPDHRAPTDGDAGKEGE